MQNLHSSARTAAKTMFKRWALLRPAKIATILMLYAVLASSCGFHKAKDLKLFTIEMKLIDGSWIKATYKLPSNSEFYIQSSRGSYSLYYTSDAMCFGENCFGTIKNAVIDYKVVSVK